MEKSTKEKVISAVKSVLKVLGTLILALLVFVAGMIYVLEKGPSEEIRDLFVVTVQQSSAAKPLAKLFLSSAQVEEIMENNSAKDAELISDPELIIIDDSEEDKNSIIIEDVGGPTYHGKMMIIKDPSRVYVYTIPDYSAASGMCVCDMVVWNGAVAGVNGGGFLDVSGLGNGSQPLGIVMSRGEWRNGGLWDVHQVIGFDYNNKLVVGNMTGNEAIERGIRDAVEWGPALVINGEAVNVGEGGGLNPRTAIGQRADGAVLLLVIDGRQPSSLGASYVDLISVMLQYGAVTAANLDGGNSSSMVYEGRIINNTAGLYGERELPTAFLVEAR